MNQIEYENYIRHVVDKYSDMIIRIAFQYTKNRSDAEDLMQDVFFALIKLPPFDAEEHLKAWIIRVTINKSKNLFKSLKRRYTAALIDEQYGFNKGDIEIMSEVQKLPEKDRDIVYLFYFEGYTAKEIASIIGKRENAVHVRLSRVREKLKKMLGEEE